VSVTSLRDGREHLVRDDEIEPGRAGQYAALCGHRVLAAVLACPAGPRCPDCTAIERNATAAAERRRAGRSGRWPRLTAVLRGPGRAPR
jgi:hypothetical protein